MPSLCIGKGPEKRLERDNLRKYIEIRKEKERKIWDAETTTFPENFNGCQELGREGI